MKGLYELKLFVLLELCAINASGSTQPTITVPLISEMLVAVVTQTLSANVRLKPEQQRIAVIRLINDR